MTKCFLSTSLCRNQNIDSSILECGELSGKKVELSAPHPNESIENITKIIKNILVRGMNLLCTIIFLHLKNHLF